MTEGSFETMAIFQTEFNMKNCNTFEMLNDDFKDKLYEMYFDHAKKMEGYKGIVLAYHTPTWRVNTDWLAKFGYKESDMALMCEKSVNMLKDIRSKLSVPLIIRGLIGPKGDGYVVDQTTRMTPQEAEYYHMPIVYSLKNAGVDVITAASMIYPEEAAGVSAVCSRINIPYIITFILENSCLLPSGETLE